MHWLDVDTGVKTFAEIFMHWVLFPRLWMPLKTVKQLLDPLLQNAFISDNFDDILGDDQIQGVALATPAETHADLAIQAMRAGKDVFVEKPMALSISDAEEMQKVANETGSHSHGGSFIGISSCGSQITGTGRLRRTRKDQLYLFKPP